MFYLIKTTMTVPIPPDQLDPTRDISDIAIDIIRNVFEGTTHPDLGHVIAVIGGHIEGLGYVTTQTPSVFFKVYVEMLVFKPEYNEVVEGPVENAIETGVFVNLGFYDAFISVNALGKDHFIFDAKTNELRGTRTKTSIRKGDWIRGRLLPATASVVTVSGGRWSKARITIRMPLRLERMTGELRVRMSSRETGLGLLKVLFKKKLEATSA